MDVTKIALLEDRILVLPDEVEATTKGGLALPQSQVAKAREEQRRGKVLLCGPGRLDYDSGKPIPMKVKVGDHVVYGNHAGVKFPEDGVEYKIVRQDDIYGILPS